MKLALSMVLLASVATFFASRLEHQSFHQLADASKTPAAPSGPFVYERTVDGGVVVAFEADVPLDATHVDRLVDIQNLEGRVAALSAEVASLRAHASKEKNAHNENAAKQILQIQGLTEQVAKLKDEIRTRDATISVANKQMAEMVAEFSTELGKIDQANAFADTLRKLEISRQEALRIERARLEEAEAKEAEQQARIDLLNKLADQEAAEADDREARKLKKRLRDAEGEAVRSWSESNRLQWENNRLKNGN